MLYADRVGVMRAEGEKRLCCAVSIAHAYCYTGSGKELASGVVPNERPAVTNEARSLG